MEELELDQKEKQTRKKVRKRNRLSLHVHVRYENSELSESRSILGWTVKMRKCFVFGVVIIVTCQVLRHPLLLEDVLI